MQPGYRVGVGYQKAAGSNARTDAPERSNVALPGATGISSTTAVRLRQRHMHDGFPSHRAAAAVGRGLRIEGRECSLERHTAR